MLYGLGSPDGYGRATSSSTCDNYVRMRLPTLAGVMWHLVLNRQIYLIGLCQSFDQQFPRFRVFALSPNPSRIAGRVNCNTDHIARLPLASGSPHGHERLIVRQCGVATNKIDPFLSRHSRRGGISPTSAFEGRD